MFKDQQQSNKKIAKYMGPNIDVNRIKLEKTRYLKEKKRRVRLGL